MYLGIIEQFESKKCTKVATQQNLLFGRKFYEIRIYTTHPKQFVPQEEKELQKIAKFVMDSNWVIEPNNQGYTHTARLKTYPNLSIRIKEIEEPNLEKDNETTN